MARAREVFKPSADSARHLVSTEKKFSFGFGVLLGGVTSGGVFGLLYPTLGAKPMSQIFRSSLFGNYTIIRVFRALDWLSSISGTKIMDQIPKIKLLK